MQELPWIAINMEHRKDRLELLYKSFPNQCIERFNAVQHDDPEIGCRESHLAVVRLAKERGYPWVLILEDDCEPYPEFQTNFANVLTYLWNNKDDWELYNGGPNPFSVKKYPKSNSILLIDSWISAQFIIVNSTAFDKILDYNQTEDSKKIDEYYNKFKTLTSTPMLTRQRDTYSDLAKSITNNIPLFEKSRNMLQMFSY